MTAASFVINSSAPKLLAISENKPRVAEPDRERVNIIGIISGGISKEFRTGENT